MSRDPLPPAQAKQEVLAAFAGETGEPFNCAQAVLRYWLLTNGQDADLTRIAAQFGGGVARQGEICGAVSGATMAFGLREHLPGRHEPSADHEETRAQLQRLVHAFSAEFGSLRCGDLTGVDLSTPEGHDTFVRDSTFDRCREFVAWMCDHLPQ